MLFWGLEQIKMAEEARLPYDDRNITVNTQNVGKPVQERRKPVT